MDIQLKPTLWIFPLLFLVSCAKESGETQHSFRIFEEDGVIIAETTGGPKFSGEIFEYEHILSLKEDPNDPDSFLDEPVWFAMDWKGWFYLPHNHDKRVQVFDDNGDYVRSFGGLGDGPGEFRNLRLQYLIGDTISIFDPNLQRMTLYRTDGTLLEVVRAPVNIGRLEGLYVSNTGNLVGIDETGQSVGNSTCARMELLVFSPSGDTLASVDTEFAEKGYYLDTSGPIRTALQYTHAPGPSAVVDVPGGRVMLTSGDEPLVRWYSMEGHALEEIILSDGLEPLTRQMLRDELAEWARSQDISEEMATGMKASIPEIQIQSHKGYSIRTIFDQGFIWLEKPHSPYAGPSPVACRIVSPDGEYLGDTTWPVKGQIYSANVMQGHFMGLGIDEETEAPFLKVFRIHSRMADLDYPNGLK